ncbi:MAG: hypothetical protein V1699_05900 [Candidatus Omnitrophota bacterium]
MKNNRLKMTKWFSKKIIGFFLAGLIFPAVILAQETEGSALFGLFTNSGDVHEQEVLKGVAKTLNLQPVWTYDGTDIITGTLGALAQYYNIPTLTNGLEDPLFSQISGYQKMVIAHSAGAGTAVTLAKRRDLWGEELYVASTVFTSQNDLRQIRNLTSQGKGFNKIILYTGDDMIPDFKELNINFSDYTIQVKITENLEVSLVKLIYEDRGRAVNILVEFLKDYAARAKAQFGKELVSVTIYGDVPGNEIAIKWEGQVDIEKFNLQNDCLTGGEFQNEDGIFNIPLYVGFLHGREQLELLAEFKGKYGRMPGVNDLELFKQIIEAHQSKSESVATTAHDPNELSVAPSGDVKPGDTLTYTIHYENEGKGIAYGVYFTDTLEEDLDDANLTIGPILDSATGQQIGEPGTYNPVTRTITWFVGEIASKQGGSATFSVKVKNTTPDKSEVINYATVYFPSVPESTRTNGTVNKVTTFVDNVPPATQATTSPLPNQAGWNNSDVTVTLTATDNQGGSGVREIHYKLTGAITEEKIISGNSLDIPIYTEGTTTLTCYAIDNAGNTETAKTITLKLDKTPPAITSQASPQPNSSGWNNSNVTVIFSATDNLSGVASVTEPATITSEGKDQHIGGQAFDLAGNQASTYVTLNIDKTKPAISITSPQENKEYFHTQAIPLTYATSDALSQIASTSLTLDSLPITSLSRIQPKVGTHTLVITATDKAGNQEILNRHFTVKLKAKITIKPEVFLCNRGIFLAFVEFPQGYDARTITDATCDGAQAKKIIPLRHNTSLLLFRREDITVLPIDTTFTLRGHFSKGLLFEGSDTIKKVMPRSWTVKDKEDEERELDQAIDGFCKSEGAHQDYRWLKKDIRELNR